MKRTLFFFAAAVSVAMFSSCAKQGENAGGATDSTQAMATSASQANITAVRGFFDNVMNKHDTGALNQYCAANFVDHNPAPGHTGQGLADVSGELSNFFMMIPDLHYTIEQISGDSNIVWVRYTMTGTWKGDMGGMKATNKSMKVGGIDEIQIQNGKATDRWGYVDGDAMMAQLGMMPPPSGAMQKK